MANKVEIKCPKKSETVKGKVWFASGIVSKKKMLVKGSIWKKDGSAKELEGVTIRYGATKRKADSAILFRWLIRFAGTLTPGEHLLRVAWTTDETVKDERLIT